MCKQIVGFELLEADFMRPLWILICVFYFYFLFFFGGDREGIVKLIVGGGRY